MDLALNYFVIGLVALGIVVYFERRGATSRLDSQWLRAFEIAKELVPALEQLFQSGQITKAQRLDHVMQELRAYFPNLTERQLRLAVESAVHWMKNNGVVELEQVTEAIDLNKDLVEQLTERMKAIIQGTQ